VLPRPLYRLLEATLKRDRSGTAENGRLYVGFVSSSRFADDVLEGAEIVQSRFRGWDFNASPSWSGIALAVKIS